MGREKKIMDIIISVFPHFIYSLLFSFHWTITITTNMKMVTKRDKLGIVLSINYSFHKLFSPEFLFFICEATLQLPFKKKKLNLSSIITQIRHFTQISCDIKCTGDEDWNFCDVFPSSVVESWLRCLSSNPQTLCHHAHNSHIFY